MVSEEKISEKSSDTEISVFKEYQLIFQPIMQVAPLLELTLITQTEGPLYPIAKNSVK